MNLHVKLTVVSALVMVCCGPLAHAQPAVTDAAPPAPQAVAEPEPKSNKTAHVVIEWATVFDMVGMSKTAISVDQTVVCKINASSKICDVWVEPGKRELTLNTNLDVGTYSEQYDFEAGKRYKLDVVMNKKNVMMDTLFGGIPVSAMFNQKGKTATLKFELVGVSDEPSK